MLNSLSYIESSFFYVSDISILKANRNNIMGNQFIITPFSYNYTEGNKTISGISYELYYIDENKNFNQLTYTFKEGNGLYIDKNLCVNLNINESSLINNEKNELTIDQDTFDLAYYNNRGILHASDNLYINDIFTNKIIEIGSMYSDAGKLSLNKGLITDLKEIIKYYENCLKLTEQINFLYGVIIGQKFYFNVGDYLYINPNGVITDQQIGDPYMVCVIASNVLPDTYARFALVKRDKDKGPHKFATDKSIPVKKAYSSVPVYDKEYSSVVTENDNVVGAKGGYFAIENPHWKNNLMNKFNSNENFSLAPYDTINSVFLDWYIDQYYVNTDELYKIHKTYGIFTEAFNYDIGNKVIIVNAQVKFQDGFVGKYLFNLDYNDNSKRFELREDCWPIGDNKKELNYPEEGNLTAGDYYYYTLKMPANMFDLDKVYISCQLAEDENCTSWYNPEYFEYNNDMGLTKTFRILQSHPNGGLKILCYGSSKYYDANPYVIGVKKPTSTEFINVSEDGKIRNYRKVIFLNNNQIINFSIEDIIPKKISIINHVDSLGEITTYYRMLKQDGTINTGNYTLVNLEYSFDMNYIITENDTLYLNTGCIKINRTDSYNYDFTVAQATVKLKVENYKVIELKNVAFVINNKILESQKYDLTGYSWNEINSVHIQKFERIDDAQETTVDSYKFDKQAKILNNN